MRARDMTSVLALILTSGAASAQVTYAFATTGSVFDVAPGGMVTIPVYLQETTAGAASSLLVAENGLFSAGVSMSRAGTLPSSPAGFVGSASVASNIVQFHDSGNAVFGPVVSVTPAQASLLEFARAAGVTGSPGAPGTRAIFLGNFHVSGGSVIGQTTTFQIADYAPTSDTVSWLNHVVIDAPSIGISPASVTVRVVNVACYANCDGSTTSPILSANDFQCFLSRFAAGDAYANCDGSTLSPLFTANDFQCFLSSFASGCL